MSIFLKFSNCSKIMVQTTYFEKIQYCKIYFHYSLGLTKTSYNDSACFFLEDILISNFEFFSKMFILLKFLNCRIIIAQTTYFENFQYCKINFHYGLGLTKTSYNDSASFFWKIFLISNFEFFQKCPFFSSFQIAA